MCKISVIIPVYNSAPYIQENIDSIINQTYKNLEIIYVDDGSSDQSCEIIKKAIIQDKRIQLIETSHGGVSAARNTGLEVASGKWISFVDSDDYLVLDAYEKMIGIVNEEYLLSFSLTWFGNISLDNKDKYEIAIRKFSDTISNKTIAENMICFYEMAVITSLCNKLFCSKIISSESSKIRFNTSLFSGEDGVFVLEYLRQVRGVKLLSDSLYKYRIYGSQSIDRHYKHYAKNYYTIYNELRSWIYDFCGAYKGIKDFGVRWLSFLERSSWEMDWNDEEEVSEFMCAVKSVHTKDMLEAIKKNKTKLRIDKRLFARMLQSGKVINLSLYGRTMKLLRKSR